MLLLFNVCEYHIDCIVMLVYKCCQVLWQVVLIFILKNTTVFNNCLVLCLLEIGFHHVCIHFYYIFIFKWWTQMIICIASVRHVVYSAMNWFTFRFRPEDSCELTILLIANSGLCWWLVWLVSQHIQFVFHCVQLLCFFVFQEMTALCQRHVLLRPLGLLHGHPVFLRQPLTAVTTECVTSAWCGVKPVRRNISAGRVMQCWLREDARLRLKTWRGRISERVRQRHFRYHTQCNTCYVCGLCAAHTTGMF